MPLADAFSRFLGDRHDERARLALSAALEMSGYVLEARLLARWEGGVAETRVDVEDSPWLGRRAWVGPALPERAEAGEIWMDVCEMTPMLLLPREPPHDPSEYAPGVLERLTPFVAWLALRPVARWQVGAFLARARLAPRKVQIPPRIRPLDPERLLAGLDDAPVTSILPDETGLYATWFGKAIGAREDWQAARAALTPRELVALWGPLRREWNGAVTEGIYSVVTPDTIDVDPDDAYDEDPELRNPDRILYGELEAPQDVGFRTHVSTQVSLRGGGYDPLSILDVQLLDSVDRA